VGSLATALAVAGTAAAGGPALLVAAGLCVAGCAVTLGWGGRAVGKSGHGDPGWVVADEVAGQAMASAVALAGPVWPSAALAFVLFRLLDIVKPWPVNRAERLPGGLGVLADDLVAGAMAAAVVLGLHLVGFP